MAKLFDQQQLSAGVQEFEEHLRRVRARDWTVDCQLAKAQNDLPAPARREGARKAAARNARGAAPAKGNTQPADLSMETFQSRRLILALAALVLVTFAGAMSLALTDGGAPTAEEDVGAVDSDAPSTAPPTSQATQANTPPVVSAPASATSETYVATIRPDGSLAPDTTPHTTVATPPAAVAAPSPDAISGIIKSGEQSGRIVATYVSLVAEAGAETAGGVLVCVAWLVGGAVEGASDSTAPTLASASAGGAASSVSASDMAPAKVTSTSAASARIKRRD